RAPRSRRVDQAGTAGSAVVNVERRTPSTVSVTSGSAPSRIRVARLIDGGAGRSKRSTRPSGGGPPVASSATPRPARAALSTPARYAASPVTLTGTSAAASTRSATLRIVQGASIAT